jgi:hypothetical protein
MAFETKVSDGNVGKCRRCNRTVVRGEKYAEVFLGHVYGGNCLPHVERTMHLFSDPNDLAALLRTQHNSIISVNTKAALAARKARLAATAANEDTVDPQLLLGMGM